MNIYEIASWLLGSGECASQVHQSPPSKITQHTKNTVTE